MRLVVLCLLELKYFDPEEGPDQDKGTRLG
jgi:hypothetical protein